jgi:arylformamidase
VLSDADREREYSPSSCIGGDYSPFLRAYMTLSRESRTATTAAGASWIRQSYGPLTHQFVDLCIPHGSTQPIPLLVFIHGGYWQELSSDDSLFAVADCVGAGNAFAAINYTLAPAATLDGIVSECSEALRVLVEQAPGLGLDASRIVVAGSSAGAHLAAMIAGSCRVSLLGVVLVSGIYWLEPLIGTSINGVLALDVAEARRNSPGLLPVDGFPQVVMCWGENETSEFKRQSLEYSDRLRGSGVAVQAFEVTGRNHFDVILDLARHDTLLGRATMEMLAATLEQ